MGEVKRCTVGLGTFVEFTLPDSLPKDVYQNVVSHMNQLEARLSVFQEGSDVSRWNRLGVGACAQFGTEFIGLLELCARLNSLSNGVFDPRLERSVAPLAATFSRDGVQLQKLQHSALDLGGIAKGYIVDQLVEFLAAEGATSGVVNAGGDLRCWGNVSRPVYIRLGRTAVSSECLKIENASVASSGWDSYCSVQADTAVLADAFTKIFLHDRDLGKSVAAQVGGGVQLVSWIGANA